MFSLNLVYMQDADGPFYELNVTDKRLREFITNGLCVDADKDTLFVLNGNEFSVFLSFVENLITIK